MKQESPIWRRSSVRKPKLLREFHASHRDDSCDKFLIRFTKTNRIILDDWLIEGLSFIHSKDMLEFLDDRCSKGSTIFAIQLPVSNWHSRFEDPTLADAIMDRVVHNAYRIKLKGDWWCNIFCVNFERGRKKGAFPLQGF